MDRKSRNKPLTIKEKRRNKRISSKRSPGERPFAVIKRVMKSGHVLVTTTARVHVKIHEKLIKTIKLNYYG
jgi:IS5 family transposase